MNKLTNKLKSVADSVARHCQGAIKALDEGAEIVADKICAAVEGVNWKRAATVVGGVGTAVFSGVTARAQSSSGPTFADPSTITSTATTVFTAVATLMVGIIGFWVVLKIVRKISGK